MKSATIQEIKNELKEHSPEEMLEYCLRLSRFKKENKELMTYLLFEASDEAAYLDRVKEETSRLFKEINTSTYYFIKKSVRKILREIRKHSRYSGKKTTEIELQLFFCAELKKMKPTYTGNQVLVNLYKREMASIEKNLSMLHEDLQYDFKKQMDTLRI